MVVKTEKKNVAWVDKQVLSKIWVNTLQKAMFSMIDHDYRSYKRGIDILINSLFKEERDKVLEYMNSFEKLDMPAYMSVQHYIIDLLEAKGYLKYKMESGTLRTVEGKAEREWENE